MQKQAENFDANQETAHFENYADYSRTLRAWLVAYGIGGPVLFLTNDSVSDQIAASGHAYGIVRLFLIGVGLQILLALINKWCAWHMYRGAGNYEYQQNWRYKFWDTINSQSWIDFWVDLMSLGAFVFATWLVLKSFLATGGSA